MYAACMLAFAQIHPGPAAMANPLLAPLLGFFGRLSYPRLFALTVALFALDVLIPDMVPFADELLLGLGTLEFCSAANAANDVRFKDMRRSHEVKQLVRQLQKQSGNG